MVGPGFGELLPPPHPTAASVRKRRRTLNTRAQLRRTDPRLMKSKKLGRNVANNGHSILSVPCKPASAVVVLIVIVTVAGYVPGTVENVQVASDGRPEHVSVGAVEKGAEELTVSCTVPVEPAVMLREDEAATTDSWGGAETTCCSEACDAPWYGSPK